MLKQLKATYREIEDIICNTIAFLYEVVCEDDPFNEHPELLEKCNKISREHWHN